MLLWTLNLVPLLAPVQNVSVTASPQKSTSCTPGASANDCTSHQRVKSLRIQGLMGVEREMQQQDGRHVVEPTMEKALQWEWSAFSGLL